MMTRNRLVPLVAALTMLGCWLHNIASAQPAPAATKLNVLLIISDDLRPELGCYGLESVQSPSIDSLAARGVRFDRAYCQYPVCNPSRVSFLTGLRPDDTGIASNNANFRTKLPDIVTLPQHFRSHGYFTASLGKVFHRGGTMEEVNAEMDDPRSWNVAKYFQATELGNTGEGRNLTGGKLKWCRWLAAEGGDDDQPDGQVAREAVKLLEANREKPFFLAVGFHKPHDPFVAPKKYFDQYPLEKISLPHAPPDQTPASPSAFAQGAYQPAFEKFTERDMREFKRAYLAGTSFIDAQVGRVIDALNRLGLAERTVVIFLGDHGYHLGERGWWNKNTLFELSCRSPLIVVAPSAAQPGRTSQRLVEFVDLYPTLIDLCALPPPAHALAGLSLRPLLVDPAGAWKEAAFTQVQRPKHIGRSVRTPRWRYTEWDEGRAGSELYDHNADPGEHHNLAADPAHARTVAQLKPLLRRQ
jgi:uncharacterized sulfatase